MIDLKSDEMIKYYDDGLDDVGVFVDVDDLQSGEYWDGDGVGGEEGDEAKHPIHAALNLQIVKMRNILYLFTF